jgi:hypothetical protein
MLFFPLLGSVFTTLYSIKKFGLGVGPSPKFTFFISVPSHALSRLNWLATTVNPILRYEMLFEKFGLYNNADAVMRCKFNRKKGWYVFLRIFRDSCNIS